MVFLLRYKFGCCSAFNTVKLFPLNGNSMILAKSNMKVKNFMFSREITVAKVCIFYLENQK